jgi:hypothetical protein
MRLANERFGGAFSFPARAAIFAFEPTVSRGLHRIFRRQSGVTPMSVLKALLSSSFVQSFATKEVRHLATAAAGALASWLVAHQASQSDAANIAEGISALIVGAGGYGLSLLNASSTEARVQVAAQTGKVVSAPQAQAILAKADAAGATAKAQLIVELEAGGPK